MPNNDYIPILSEVQEIVCHTAHEWTFRLSYDDALSVKPSQFFEISIPKYGESPISVSGIAPGLLDCTIRKIGHVTNEISASCWTSPSARSATSRMRSSTTMSAIRSISAGPTAMASTLTSTETRSLSSSRAAPVFLRCAASSSISPITWTRPKASMSLRASVM